MDNPQLALARRYVEQTGVSLFLTGKAGTGKTTFLRDIDMHCPKRHVVVAPTGVAAVNAGGVTIHSFFQLPFDPYLPDVKELVTEYQMPDSHKSLSKTKVDIIRTLELLIIDEISMVRADLLDAIDMTLRRHRRSSRPFGGVQLLMIGDVHQLPPVVKESERQYMERVYPSPFFFHSKALQRIQYVTIELTTVYRQQDAAFVGLLNNVRDNRMDGATLAALNGRCGTPQRDAITLTTHNRQADAINSRHMEELKGKSREMEAVVKGNFPDGMANVERHLTLKVGERVMFVKNDSSGEHRYYNGKLATVTDFVTVEDDEYVEVVDDDGDTVQVGRETWENIKYSIDPGDNQIKQDVDGTLSQYPLRAAWAVTIHKAQGLTFDRVSINAADAFAFGQVYVALSRCRSLEGLTLTTPLSAGVTFGDADVQGFCDAQPTYEQVEAAAPQCERQYYYEQLDELFNMDGLMDAAERLNSVYRKLAPIYPKKVEAMNALCHTAVELASVGERFRNQLARLPQEQHAERVAKGSEWYAAQLSAVRAALGALLEVDIDNKETGKQVREAGEALTERVRVKEACMKAVQKNGFSVANVQKAKADSLLGGRRKAGNTERRTKKERQPEKVEVDDENVDATLVSLIKEWRKQKAQEQGVGAFMILHQKAVMGIAQVMPRTEKELMTVPGIGKAKMAAYSKEILDLVADYCEAYGIKNDRVAQ